MHFTDKPGNVPQKYRAPRKKPQAKIKKRVAIGGGYSFEIPGDWKIEKRGSLRYKLIFTDERDGYEPHCALDEFKGRNSFEKFTISLQAAVKRAFTDYRVVKQSKFSAGYLRGLRISERFIDKLGKNARRESYYFPVSSEKKVALTCQAAVATGAKLDDVFDEIASSLIAK